MSNIIPAMVSSWLEEMKNPKNKFGHRQNYYMMLEHMVRTVDKDLKRFELELSKKNK